MSVPNVLHVTTVHRPFDARIFYKEIRSLIGNGFKVDFATTAEASSVSEGARIIPLGAPGGPRVHRIVRCARAFNAMLKHREGIVHIHDPELVPIALLPAMLGARVVYDVHEFHAHNVLERGWIPSWMRPAISAAYRGIERFALRWFAGIVVVVEEMIPHYAAIAPGKPVALVRNFPNITADELAEARRAPHPLGGRPYVLHTGGAARRVSFHVVVEAAERLRRVAPDLLVVNIGEVDLTEYPEKQREELRTRAEAVGMVQLPRMATDEVFPWLVHARMGYVPLADTDNHRFALPNKLFEYFLAGLPVVASSVGVVRSIVSETGAGIVVPEEDASAHAQAMAEIHHNDALHSALAHTAKQASARYTFQAEGEALKDLYLNLPIR